MVPEAVLAHGDEQLPSSLRGPVTIVARRFGTSGAPVRDPVFISGDGLTPSVGLNGAGDFVVGWYNLTESSDTNIHARRFDAANQPLEPDIRVNTLTADVHLLPSVAIDAAVGFVAAWTAPGQVGPGSDVYARRLAGDGLPPPPPRAQSGRRRGRGGGATVRETQSPRPDRVRAGARSVLSVSGST